jgi:hypothetical protein
MRSLKLLERKKRAVQANGLLARRSRIFHEPPTILADAMGHGSVLVGRRGRGLAHGSTMTGAFAEFVQKTRMWRGVEA